MSEHKMDSKTHAAPGAHPAFQRIRPDWPPVGVYIGRELLEVNHDGNVRLRYRAQPEWANGRGDVQGGFVAVMLDSALGAAAVAQLPSSDSVATIEMKVSYIRPTPMAELIGHGRVAHKGSSTVFAEGELRTTDGLLLATATATLRIVQGRRD